MPPYLFPLPTTSLITYSNVFIDPSGTHTTVLADATSARTKLHLALKGVAAAEPGSSALAVVEAVQIYLPYLRGIMSALDADKLIYKSDPLFPWRSPLTHYISTGPLLSLPSIHAEHLFVLLTYTLALSNYASSILASLPQFEGLTQDKQKTKSPQMHGAQLSSEDEKRTAAGLARAVDLLCQAAGVAEWIGENVMVVLEPIRAASGGRAGKHRWPIEAGAEAYRGLAMILLADAHVTAIRKLLLPVLSHTLFSPPGPPLPSNHPSPSLLAKLYLHTSSLYSSARALFHVHSSDNTASSSSSSKRLFRNDKSDEPDSVEGEVIPGFKRYLRKESMLSLALAHKWMAVDSGENTKSANRNHIGEAIAWLRDSQGRLEELADSSMRDKMKGLGIGKSNERKKEERRARQGRVERELDDVGAWLRSYVKQNDTVAFQPIPQIGGLTIPSGRPIFGAKAWKPPSIAAAFEYTTGDDEDSGGGRHPGEMARQGAQPGGEDESSYAGKGTYF